MGRLALCGLRLLMEDYAKRKQGIAPASLIFENLI